MSLTATISIIGAALALIGSFMSFNEWRHRVTQERANADSVEMLRLHDQAETAHLVLVERLHEERAKLFGGVHETLKRIEIGIARGFEKFESSAGVLAKITSEHELQMRMGCHTPGTPAVCAECSNIVNGEPKREPSDGVTERRTKPR